MRKLNRGIFDGTYNEALRVDGDGPNRSVELTESWIKADRDGDGYAEWRHVFTIGGNLLEDEAWEGEPPFVAFSFWPIDFKFYGMSAWDVLKDYHRNKTGLMRGYLDAINQNNTFRMIADTRFLDQRLAQSGKPGIYPARPGFDPTKVLMFPKVPVTEPTGALKYLDEQIEMEIGINPRTGAISADVEKSGNDAAKTSMIIDNASAKVEIYGRRFAEAMKQVTWLAFDLLIKNSDSNTVKAMVDIVTPGQPFLAAEHKLDKTALSVTVGLGHLTTEQKLQALQLAKQQQLQYAAEGINIPLENKLKLDVDTLKAIGLDNAYDYLPDPEALAQHQQMVEEAKQQQQPDPALQLEMMKVQAEIKKLESETVENNVDAEVKAKKQALDETKAAAEIAIEMQQGRPADIG